jgi:hypothetical protein
MLYKNLIIFRIMPYETLNSSNSSLINVWYGSYIAYTDYFIIGGKTCVFTGRKPL